MKITIPRRGPPPLFDHQKEALSRMRMRGRTTLPHFGLLMDPGTGKTRVVIDRTVGLYETGRIDTLIVLAPNGVHSQWVEEQFPEHCSIPYQSIVWTSNRGKEWKARSKQILRKRKGLLVATFNYEALTTKDGVNFLKWLVKNRRCFLVADESSRIRNPRAIRTKVAMTLSPLAPYRVIMTGTPITKGFENLWSQLNFLDPSILHCSSFVVFKARYCKTVQVPGRRGVSMITGYKNLSDLMGRIEPFVYIKKKEDCLDLPDKIYVKSPVPMSPDQARAYATMREELLVNLDGLDQVTVAHMISARAKLRQIALGFILDEGVLAAEFPTPRYDRLLEHIEEGGPKQIIWSTFRHALHRIEAELTKANVSYVRYVKGDSETRRRFMQDPGIQVFLGNPHSGGIGLNLAIADTMIFFNNTDDAEIRWQSEDRAHRIGQINHLSIVDMFAPNTVESKMLRDQITKEGIADMLMRRRWRDLI